MTAERRIWLARPRMSGDELEEVRAVLESGILTQGPKVAELEGMVAGLVGVPHAFAVTSATTALHLSLVAAGIGPGDEVLVPDFTFPATANVVVQQGAVPVLVDIDLDTYAVDPELLDRHVTSRTRAVIPVHPFGLPADMDAVLDVAGRRGLAVIEDAACALGTTYAGVHVGTFGDLGCFSFHPRKSISTGEGGLIVARDGVSLERARSLRNHGVAANAEPGAFGDLPDHSALGFNYRMTDLQAAIGLVQMTRLAGILAGRRQVAESYDSLLSDVPWLKRPPLADGHSFQSYVCLSTPLEPTLEHVDALHIHRSALMTHLARMGIETRPGTHAPVRMSYYRTRYGIAEGAFPNAIVADRASVALPLFAGMEPRQIDFVVSTLREAPVA
jgi:dTDP-4-amino-4,6-dideoxygalactose transaminase